MAKKKLAVIHTGGTIAMVEEDTGTDIASGSHPLDHALHGLSSSVSFNELNLFQLPSPHMTPSNMMTLTQEIKRQINEEKVDGIVVTHGTDTLEETAYFIDLLTNTDIPIVVTGSMRSSNEPGYDGYHNLLISAETAMSDDAKGKGVLVVLNDEIHAAKNVTKTHTSNVATFQSPQFGPMGIVTKRGVFFHHAPTVQEHYPVRELRKKAALLKAYAGMEASLLRAIVDNGYDGIVIEAFGQGNLPAEVVPEIEHALQKGIPVVIVSRCFNGIVSEVYGYQGGGKQLKDLGVILSNGLNGQKARIKLTIALELTSDDAALQDIFNK